MASQHTTQPDQQSNQYDRHSELYNLDSEINRGAERRRRRVGREAKVNFLQKHYREKLGITEDDFWFIECIGHLEVQGVVHIHDGQGTPITRDHYLTEGHRWVVDRFDPDIERLREVGLIQKPHVDGDPRDRIIYRRFWDLTPSGRDLVDIDKAGVNIGDPGEHVVHKLGHHMTRWWAEEQWCGNDFHEIESYPTVNGAELDFCVWSLGGFQFIDGKDVDKHVRRAFEIETGVSDPSGDLQNDALKLAHTRGDSIWAFPNREVLVKALDELTLRGYTGLNHPIPETLAIRNHRDTYNKRLAEAKPENTHLPYDAVDRVMTYKQLVDDLKEWRPELFYGPRDADQ